MCPSLRPVPFFSFLPSDEEGVQCVDEVEVRCRFVSDRGVGGGFELDCETGRTGRRRVKASFANARRTSRKKERETYGVGVKYRGYHGGGR